jgi:hypothetical protein
MISETERVDGEHLDLFATLETPDARQEVLQSAANPQHIPMALASSFPLDLIQAIWLPTLAGDPLRH